jgi:hypothetical protein
MRFVVLRVDLDFNTHECKICGVKSISNIISKFSPKFGEKKKKDHFSTLPIYFFRYTFQPTLYSFSIIFKYYSFSFNQKSPLIPTTMREIDLLNSISNQNCGTKEEMRGRIILPHLQIDLHIYKL